MYDLIIIGAGPAGLSAAIYAARRKLKTLVISSQIGGQGTGAWLVENYLGLPEIPGKDLAEKFEKHAKKFKIEIKEGITAQKITKKDDGSFEVESNVGVFLGRTILIAAGKKYRELEIPGAEQFKGKGITYCAVCDAPIFKDKIVAVVGGGDAGFDTALQLTAYAAKVYLVNKYPEARGDNKGLEEKIKNNEKIEIILSSVPKEIKGGRFVESLVVENIETKETRELKVAGIFVQIGSVAASKIIKGLAELNQKEEIIIDQKTNMSSCPGIFAAGDVSDIPHKQIIIAAGEGAKAALSASDYLKNK